MLVSCKECGNSVSDQGATCPSCGCPLALDTKSSFGYALLGFLIPIVGLVLYLVWNGTKPGPAKSAGRGALVSFIIGLVFYIAMIALASVSGY